MAIPALVWTQPVGASPATTAETHKLNNDLVVVSDKFGTTGTFAPGGPNTSKSGKYMVAMNDVDRSDTAYSPAVESPASPAVPAHSTYTYTDRGHISLNGGVFELHPFSSGVKGGTTTYTDFGGSGRSPYPENYTTLAPGTSNNPGVPICGTTNYQNVESLYTYTTGTMTVGPNSTGQYGTGATPAGPGDPSATPAVPATAATLSGEFTSYWGVHTGPGSTLCSLTGAPHPALGWTTAGSPFTQISEHWFVGQGFQNGTNSLTPHKGAIAFKVSPDTECELISGNDLKTVNGTANWANGQSRTVTITAADHGLVDTNNRIYITGASNNAINGIWNVATVTNSSQFTTTIFAANCEDGGVDITGLNIVTYDGIDKTGGVLRSSSGTIVQVYQRRDGTYGNPSADPATSPSHTITYWYDGPHGVATSGEVSIKGTGAYDFSGNVTRSSGTRLERSMGGGAGYFNDTIGLYAGDAKVYAAENDITVIAGGMYGNNKVIVKGTVSISQGAQYAFCANSSTDAIHTDIVMSSSTRPRSMFTDAKLNVADSGRVYTTGAPSIQPTSSSGGFDGVNGGMAPIDDWCPHYMHGRVKAQERNDPAEVLKSNTSAFDASQQMLNSPLIDGDGNLSTYMHPRHGFHQTIHFSLQAYKNTHHTTSGRSHTADSNDYVTRDFHINVHQNMKAAKNDFIVTYPVDSDNNFEVANTETAMKDLEANTFQSNYDWLANSYSNGTFSNL